MWEKRLFSVLCAAVKYHVSAHTLTMNISITLYVIEEVVVMCLALEGSVLLAKPFGENKLPRQTGRYLLLNLASVIITKFLISLWKKQLISLEIRTGESSRADD